MTTAAMGCPVRLYLALVVACACTWAPRPCAAGPAGHHGLASVALSSSGVVTDLRAIDRRGSGHHYARREAALLDPYDDTASATAAAEEATVRRIGAGHDAWGVGPEAGSLPLEDVDEVAEEIYKIRAEDEPDLVAIVGQPHLDASEGGPPSDPLPGVVTSPSAATVPSSQAGGHGHSGGHHRPRHVRHKHHPSIYSDPIASDDPSAAKRDPGREEIDAEGELQKGDAVAGWLLMHLSGTSAAEFHNPTSQAVVGLRQAVADALDICRPAVQIMDLHVTTLAVEYSDPSEAGLTQDFVYEGPDEGPLKHPSLVHQVSSYLFGEERRSSRFHRHKKFHPRNVTQVRAIYEVAVFGAMRLNSTQVAHRVDRLQSFSHFADLDVGLMRAIGASQAHPDESGLDDVGFATVRPSSNRLTSESVADCLEEGRLHDARTFHQYVMLFSFAFFVLLAGAGTAVFSVQQASSVPSRVNPLQGRF